jgi:hypothetical protein
MVEARAVRKAVTSSALIRPVVRPRSSRRVREPRMVDSGFLGASAESVAEETELCPVARLLIEAVEAVVLAGNEDIEDAVVGVEADCGVVRLLFELLRLC